MPRKSNINKFYLLIILILALGLRLNQTFIPLGSFHPVDEHDLVESAMGISAGVGPLYLSWPGTLMMLLGSFWFDFCLVIYKFVGNYSLNSPWEVGVLFWNKLTFWYWLARSLNVILGALTIGGVYLLGKKCFNRKVGLLAAFLLSINHLHIQLSSLATFDCGLSFMAMLFFVILFSYKIEYMKKFNFIMGLIIGLSMAIKYTGLFLVIPLLVFNYKKIVEETEYASLHNNQEYWLKISRIIFQTIAGIVLGFYLGCPWLTTDTLHLIKGFWVNVIQQGTSGWIGSAHQGPGWFYILTSLLPNNIGFIITMVFIIGSLLLFLKSNWLLKTSANYMHKIVIIFSFIFPYLIFISLSKTIWPRYLLPIIPFICLYVAFIIDRLISLDTPNRGLKILILSLLLSSAFAEQIWVTINKSLYERRPDSRIITKKWVEAKIASGKNILAEAYGPGLSSTQESLKNKINQLSPLDNTSQWLNRSLLMALQDKNNFNRPTYNISEVNPSEITEKEIKKVTGKVYEYVIINSFCWQRYFGEKGKLAAKNHPDQYKKRHKFYQLVKANYKLIYTSQNKARNLKGPIIKIYKKN